MGQGTHRIEIDRGNLQKFFHQKQLPVAVNKCLKRDQQNGLSKQRSAQ